MLARAEFAVRVRTNELGFREPRLPAPKPPGTVRIVALGDSFTQGYGVTEAEAYPRRLEALLDARLPGVRHEVVNLGVPGTNPRDYAAALSDPGLRYGPDVVLVGVMANDVQDIRIQDDYDVQFASDLVAQARADVLRPPRWWRTMPRKAFPGLYPLVWRSMNLVSVRAAQARDDAPTAVPSRTTLPVARWPEVLLAMGARLGRRDAVAQALTTHAAELAAAAPVLVGAVPLDAPEAADPYARVLAAVSPSMFVDAVLLPPEYDEAWARTTRTLSGIDATARRAGARCVIVFIPAVNQVTPAARSWIEQHGFRWDDRTLVDTEFADRLRAFGRATGVQVVDLLPLLRDHRAEDLYYPADGHWTAAGHALAAAAIADALQPRPQ